MTKLDALINVKPMYSFSLGKNLNSIERVKNHWFFFLFQNVSRNSVYRTWLKMSTLSICVYLSRGMKPDFKTV